MGEIDQPWVIISNPLIKILFPTNTVYRTALMVDLQCDICSISLNLKKITLPMPQNEHYRFQERFFVNKMFIDAVSKIQNFLLNDYKQIMVHLKQNE